MARKTSSPREVEANLLLQAAAQLQSVQDSWEAGKTTLGGALLFNRKLWSIFLGEMMDANNPMPREIRQNVANLGLFVLNHTVVVMNDPRPERLNALIRINRELATGLLGKG